MKKSSRRFVAACFAGTCLIHSAVALDPKRAVTQYGRQRWGTEQGFSRGAVYSIAQSSDGYLWIGTEAGLIRYDGTEFRRVADDRGEFNVVGVHEMATANDGSLWLHLADLSLLRYRNGVFEGPLPGSPNQRKASAMGSANGGEFLIADPEKGVLRFSDGQFRLVAPVKDLSRTPLTAATQLPDGSVLVGTREAGVFRFEPGGVVPVENLLPGAKVNCLLSGEDGEFWIGTDDGLVRRTGSNLSWLQRGFQVLTMARDRDGNLWIGTDSRGLLRWNAQGVERLGEVGGGVEEAVTALFEDREGNLWVGSANGLERLRDIAFTGYLSPEGRPADGNGPLFADAEGRIWFTPSPGGLHWARDGEHGALTADGLDRDVVYSIAGGNGEVWLGRRQGGLTRVRTVGGQFAVKSYTQADGLAQNSVFSVYWARDGTVWAGTLSGGASHWKGGKFTTYMIADGLASETVSSIVQDRVGRVWFATPSGLTEKSAGRWKTYSTRDGLPSADIKCLLEDSKGGLWVGTEAGLAFGDGRGFRASTGAGQLLREPVMGMAEDSYGWLWISTASHVLRVRRELAMSGALREADVHEFGVRDGLRGAEGVRRDRSAVTDEMGRVWLSRNEGIFFADPRRMARDSALAIVHVTSIWTDARALAMNQTVQIPGGAKRITFGFTGLCLSAPERVRYRYRLDGYDHDWSEPTSLREANYTNLAPGPYRFRVIASNPDGAWSQEEAVAGLAVDPLYWQTWWFVGLVMTATTLGIAGVYRIRMRRIAHRLNIRFEERLEERTRLARELHDTLLQTIQGSKMIADDGLDDPTDPARLHRALERVSTFLARAIEEGRAALSALRSPVERGNDLAGALARAGQNFDRAKKMEFALNVTGTPRDVRSIVRDEVYRIGHEAIRNACLHSRGTRVEMELCYGRDLLVRVRDNGIGIDSELAARGKDGHFGITGMRERARRIGGKLRWKCADPGTEVELIVAGKLAYCNGERR